MHEAMLSALKRELAEAGAATRKVKAGEFRGTNSCPDLWFSTGRQSGYGDVTVFYANALSAEERIAKDTEGESEGRKTTKPIERKLHTMEMQKEQKYQEQAERTGTVMWGLALSSGGWAGPRLTQLIDLIANLAHDNFEAPAGLYRAAVNQRLSVAFHKAKVAAFYAGIGAYTKKQKKKKTTKESLPHDHLLHAPLEETFAQFTGRVSGFCDGEGWGGNRC